MIGKRYMVWRGWETDPTTDPAAADVLAAFEGAQEARQQTVDCYLAGVEARRKRTPRPISGLCQEAGGRSHTRGESEVAD